ncbi:MAG: SGNH/GDSL hydrolase family protein [Chloroflexi bacterium]|nr:SGNH/GDSL hydrolase family protein [Chloroflexota bacterium]
MHRYVLVGVTCLLVIGTFFMPDAAGPTTAATRSKGATMGQYAVAPDGWVPTLTARARLLYRQSLRAGRNPNLFTLAGDSNSTYSRYLGRVVAGAFDLAKYPNLKPVAKRYWQSFTRQSVAVAGGLRAADMFDVERHASGCREDEGLFACELRASNASVVFILLGTGDKFAWLEFEANYRAMIDHAIQMSVLPVLVTKADDIESVQGGASDGYINAVIRRLASEYQLPLLDLWAATRDLPTIPNPNLPHRPFTQHGLHDEWGLYFHLTDEGQAVHILLTLQMLEQIARLS